VVLVMVATASMQATAAAILKTKCFMIVLLNYSIVLR
jgi:hypothetical protein